jgi:hypothetical protein
MFGSFGGFGGFGSFGGFGGNVYQVEVVRVCDMCLLRRVEVPAVGSRGGLDLCEGHLEAAREAACGAVHLKAALREAALREAAREAALREAVHLEAALREAALYDMFSPASSSRTGTESARAIRCNHCDGRGQCTEMTTSKSRRCKLHKRKAK